MADAGAERVWIVDIAAFDWNRASHVTPRQEELSFGRPIARIRELQAQTGRVYR